MAGTPKWFEEGEHPDYRFSLANERTFLAWVRTALAILAGSILLHEFSTRIEPRVVVSVFSVLLALLAGLLAGSSYPRWRSNESAMRHSRPLPLSRLPLVLSASVLALSLACVFILLIQ